MNRKPQTGRWTCAQNRKITAVSHYETPIPKEKELKKNFETHGKRSFRDYLKEKHKKRTSNKLRIRVTS